MIRRATRAAILAALVVCGGVCAAAADNVAPDGTLPSGAGYRLRRDATQPAAAIALWFRAPASGFDAPAPGLSRLAAVAIAGSTPITGTPLARLVEGYGGRVGVSVAPDSVAVTALVPAERAAATVRAITADYFAPVLDDAGLRAARSELGEEEVYRSFSSEAIDDAVTAALFSAGPAHDGTTATAQVLGAMPLDRLRAFAERAFRPANALLVLTGNVDAALLANAASRDGAPAGAEPAVAQTAAAPGTELRRDGNLPGIALGWLGPPIANEAEATALDFLADFLSARSGPVVRELGSRKAVVEAKFVTYRDPGVFLVTITGADAQAARPVVESAVAGLAKPMPPDVFREARAAFEYRILSQIDTPVGIADALGWYAVEGGPAYAPGEGGLGGRYFSAAARLTPQSVAAVAARWLRSPTAVVTVVRRASVSTRGA